MDSVVWGTTIVKDRVQLVDGHNMDDICSPIAKLNSANIYIQPVQGVVTPIGAVLTAETGDTICVHRNSAVTP